MSVSKAPRTLRANTRFDLNVASRESESARTVAVACLVAATSITRVEAQEASSPLPPVTVDAPVATPRPLASKPSPAHNKARAAIRRRAKELQGLPAISRSRWSRLKARRLPKRPPRRARNLEIDAALDRSSVWRGAPSRWRPAGASDGQAA
jgi:hypothetical protein